MDVISASELLRLLGDPVRLRLLRILSDEALNVSELTTVLGIAQSGVSRHLGLLRDGGLVVEDRTGGYAWYRLAPDAGDPKSDRRALWTWLRGEFRRSGPATAADDARLQEVRRLRKESFLAHGTEARRGQLVPGRSWAAWSRALGLLLPPLDVVDLGCGEGYLAIEAAQWARHVVAIDRAPEVLAHAKALATRRKVANIVWKRGEMERVPLPDATADVVLLSQALHHAVEPGRALAEAFRLLRPGGRVLVLDLRDHDQHWVKRKLGDLWEGFAPERLKALLQQADFREIEVRVGARTTGDPFVVLVAAGTKSSPQPATRPSRAGWPSKRRTARR
jgi:ArsR family transcriptional regulator